jgi:putative thymidine phosphorylase
MKFKIKKLGFLTGMPVCILHESTIKKMGLHVGNRVLIKNNNNKIISVIDSVSKILHPEEIAISQDIYESLDLDHNKYVDVEIIEPPHSIELIKKKIIGKRLNKKEINEIISNISNNSLTEVEVAFFISSVYDKEMSLKEIKYLTEAMVKSGKTFQLKGKVADKHCIGGIAGNRTTPLVVSICACAGLIIPKTSSRAITSAAGTADVMEMLCKVDFPISEIKRIIKKTNACLVWGGSLGLAPVDDKIIRIERIVNIDSTTQLLASILSKKISVGSKYVIIDIPYGQSAKIETKKHAEELKKKFIKLSKMFNLKIEVVLTEGSEPIGNGIGPLLEIEDVLKVLMRINPPKDLEQKSIMLAGKLLELTNKAKKGCGESVALEILNLGLAFKKFKEIVKAQKGQIKEFKKSDLYYDIKSEHKHLDNKLINRLAILSGCPEDKISGVYLHKKKGDVVEKSEILFTIYSVSKEKLEYAKEFYKEFKKEIIEYC